MRAFCLILVSTISISATAYAQDPHAGLLVDRFCLPTVINDDTASMRGAASELGLEYLGRESSLDREVHNLQWSRGKGLYVVSVSETLGSKTCRITLPPGSTLAEAETVTARSVQTNAAVKFVWGNDGYPSWTPVWRHNLAGTRSFVAIRSVERGGIAMIEVLRRTE
jgi:hypothetical protein